MIQVTLTPGAPQEPREDNEQAVYDKLTELGIDFIRADHDAVFTMEECGEIAGALGCPVPKNLWLSNRQKTQFYLLIMPADKPFVTKDLSKALGCSRLSFGPEDALYDCLAIRPGAVSPMGLVHDTGKRVQFLVDEALLVHEELAFHPCRNTSTVKLQTRELLERYVPATGHTVIPIKL